MSKQIKDVETEVIIRRAAKKLFFEEGKFNATTQEIADAAGVNRTLINYYFRSRDNLFNLIFEEAVKREEELREKILYSELPFKEKIELYIEDSIHQAQNYPYLETYIVSRINDGCFYDETVDFDKFRERFFEEIQSEIEKGTIDAIEPIQFILNIASLTAFPNAIRPLFKTMMKLSDETYDQLIADRKEIIMKMLFKN